MRRAASAEHGWLRSVFDALIAAGVTPEPYAAPPRMVNVEKLGYALIDLGKLEAVEAAAAATAKPKDRLYWRRKDRFPENNPKLARLFATAGVDVNAVFDVAVAP